MSAIQSNVGLITGIPIVDTVDQLIAVSAQPRDALVNRTAGITAERTAVDALAAQVLSLQFSANTFNSFSTFNGRSVASSSSNVSVSVTAGESPAVGSFQFTPLQTASAQQFVSDSFSDLTDALGEGELSFRFGSRVDQGVDLSQLNDGQGVSTGQIRIIDRSGASGVIDLRAAQTIDDVLLAINSSVDVSVTASVDGDSLTITDRSGGTGNFNVLDVGLGTTAADLGFNGTAVSADSITGADVFGLSTSSTLASLNDGAGVRTIPGVDDLSFTLADGAQFGVDLTGSETIGDVINAINDATDNAGALTATINADGDGLLLTDNTGGTGNLIVGNTSADLGSAATDLGVVTSETGVASATLDGSPLVAGLADSLLSSLNGGQGFALGEININTRSGTDVTVDLSSAQTLSEVVSLIDAASPGLSAAVNDAGNGLVITDNTGGTGNLTITDVGATTTATDLGIVVDAAQSTVDSGSLNLQAVSESTLLSSLGGGEGIDAGNFFITDSAGEQRLVNLLTANGSEPATTLGDVIDAINAVDNGVLASLNAAGDGILLTDTAGGDGTLTVTESGSGTTAADLNLLGASSSTDAEGRQTIDGSTSFSVDLTDLEATSTAVSLASLNGGAGVDAGLFQVTAASGESFVVNLATPGNEAFTIDDVINQINDAAAAAAGGAGVAVTAALNSAGTGIELTDASGGDAALTVTDLGSGTAAADLNLAGEASAADPTTINSGALFTAIDPDQGALQTVADRINAFEAGVTASVIQDGSGFRLAISVNEPGAANQIVIDAGGSGLSFSQTSQAQDAVALLGPAGGGIAVTSTDNTFNDLVDGLDITVSQATGETSTIDVSTDDSSLVNAAQNFVDSFNAIRSALDTTTSFNPETFVTGVLFGRSEVIRVEADLTSVVSGSLIFGAQFGTLESVGISLGDDGQLSLNASELTEAFAENAAAVEQLFTDEQNGLVAQVSSTIDTLAAGDNSLLVSRSAALTASIDLNNERIADFNTALDDERNQLLEEFFALEQTISLLQSNLNTLSALQPVQAS